MDPLSIIASLLAVATAGVQSTRFLKDTIKQYKTRDSTIQRLFSEVEDTENSLTSLVQLLEAANQRPAVAADTSMAGLLLGPIKRCSQLCGEFEAAMRRFSGKSKSTFIDWARMEFMKGDINQFMDALARYKATISVGLGVLTMHTVRLSEKALEEFEEMVKNTMYSLSLQLQRINDKMETLPPANDGNNCPPKLDIDLNDERQVTEQCLQICEDAKRYIESLASRDPTLLPDPVAKGSAILQEGFIAQLLTRRTLSDNQASLVKIITELRERLETVIASGDSRDRRRLEEDIQTSKQCLEVCKLASSEVTSQKIHIIGEAVADGESDHMVVTTLADIFNVGKTMSTNRSSLLVGSMSDDALVQLSHDRYSRFGTLTTTNHTSLGRTVAIGPETVNTGSSIGHQQRKAHQTEQRNPPSSNETRRRATYPENHHPPKPTEE